VTPPEGATALAKGEILKVETDIARRDQRRGGICAGSN